MITFTVDHRLPELAQRIAFAERGVGDWSAFFDAFHALWVDSREEMFNTAGASADSPWPMYSRATKEAQYAAVKSKIFGRRMSRADLLRWHGGQERLYPSIVDPNHPEHVYMKSTDRATMGTMVPYAKNHEMGQGKMPEWAGGHQVPLRRLMNLGHAFQGRIAALVSAHVGAGVIANIDGRGKERAGMTREDYLRMAGML